MILRRCGLIAPVFRSATHHSRFSVSVQGIGMLREFAAQLGTYVLDVLFPQACMLCGEAVNTHGAGLCADCYGRIEKITGPVCTCCGAVFNSPHGGDHLCGDCIVRRVHYDCVRSAGVYAGELRRAIQQFKFKRRSMLAGPLADFAACSCEPIGQHRDYAACVPVPLHPKRLRYRGYNQALLLALHLGKKWKVPVERDYLQRTAWSVSQTSLRRSQRCKAVRGVFTCRCSSYAGKRLLLIDDVFTSGATVNECARILKRYGAAAVDVLTVARTLKGYP
jgi:ComF family protein